MHYQQAKACWLIILNVLLYGWTILFQEGNYMIRLNEQAWTPSVFQTKKLILKIPVQFNPGV